LVYPEAGVPVAGAAVVAAGVVPDVEGAALLGFGTLALGVLDM
jgi:hypothetical protein